MGSEECRKRRLAQAAAFDRVKLCHEFEGSLDIGAGSQTVDVTANKGVEIVSEHGAVDVDIARHIFDDPQILIRHVARIDDFDEH